jgi:hypothetical protein
MTLRDNNSIHLSLAQLWRSSGMTQTDYASANSNKATDHPLRLCSQ